MEFIRNLSQLRPRHQGCVATIGNFDGLHLGHQAVLQQLIAKANQLQLPTLVTIFEPQPQEFFAPDTAPARLTRRREKLIAMRRYGVDRVLCLRFDAQFAALSAEAFIQQVLVKGLGVRHLVVGDDFRFGQGRSGNFAALQQAGKHYGFAVESQHTFLMGGERVSSTRVRQALMQGDMQGANELLGRPFTLWGRVRYGQQRGRSIGFPTANIFLHRPVSPLNGVFAVYLHGFTKKPLAGVANLGTRPTVDGSQLLLEVHLFGFKETIYGHSVEVEFVRKLRDEQRFASIEALKQQIDIDVRLAKAVLIKNEE
ncbi:MAG: bifunctional riboflavin kinase/FAD synthetase [Candidatus Parabeggiatoa sp. nov. 2]|nr:MAG: riboflavin biosynthesis protein RibF [Beggiatoa sp. 4572_84]RKZ57392.1 MAG: bifunctional riboflavin kinase/FAD synthetase [Gammaproteobacteria bacterium]HEC83979.1 bifunctional riboflavin kinase/FAD synthetase [Thioploca sp.]